jgi:uncharacterized protein (TIGR03437 family)
MIEDPADAAEVETVAPGQLLSLYGSDLAPAGVATYAGGYPTLYNGVTVTFDGIPAPILYTSPNQINLEVPYEIAGQAQVVMVISSQNVSPVLSEQYYLAVAASRASIFVGAAAFAAPIFDQGACNGQTVSGIQPLAFNSDGSLNSCANPAAAGSTVTVFLNAVGVTNPAQTTGAISASAVPLTPAAAYISPTGQTITALTTTLAGDIADVVEVQFPAPATSAAISLQILGATGSPLVRGPGVLVWVQ